MLSTLLHLSLTGTFILSQDCTNDLQPQITNMKKPLFSFLLLFTFIFSVSAQKAQVAKPDASVENLRKHIEYLASDQLEGRRTGEPGATAAAGYVANMFANVHLKPGFTDKNGKANFMQPFPYVTGVEVAPTGNAFSLSLNQVDSKNITVETATPVTPIGFSPNGSAENAPIVFAGYGIVSADPKFDDYANLEVRG